MSKKTATELAAFRRLQQARRPDAAQTTPGRPPAAKFFVHHRPKKHSR